MALKSELEENPFEPPIDDDFLKTALEYRDNFENDEDFQDALIVWPRCPDCGRRRVARCPVCKTSGTLFPLGDANFWDFRSDEEKARDAELDETTEDWESRGCGGCGRVSSSTRRQNRAWADVGRSKSASSPAFAPSKSRWEPDSPNSPGSRASRDRASRSCSCSCSCGRERDLPRFAADDAVPPTDALERDAASADVENLFEKGLVAVCHVCSEAFVPKFPKHCEWCDFEFPDGEEPTDASETPADVLAFLIRKQAEEADDLLDQASPTRVYWTLAALALGGLALFVYFAALLR